MMTSKYIIAVLFTVLWCTALPLYGEGVQPHRGLNSGFEPAMHSRVPENFTPQERRITEPDPAKGRFLVATPRLNGSVFEQSVILLIDYSLVGATGLIINKLSAVTASEAFPDIRELADYRGNINLGGPIKIRHFLFLIRSGNRPLESKEILQDLYFSASMNTLKESANRKEKGVKFRMYFGYSGWSPGQLEREIRRGSWYVMEGEQDVVFSEKTSLIWQNLIRKRSPFYDTVLRESDDDIPVAGL